MRLFALLTGCLTAVLAPIAFAATSGIVVHATSSDPIAGARVTLRRMPAPLEQRIQVFSGTTPTLVASTTTGKDGVFTFNQNADGMFLVEVEHDGFAPESVLALAGTSATTIALKPAAPRTGRVTANGKPVKDAIVLALAGNNFRWTGKTNDDGVYTMPAPYGRAYIVAILHPDFATNIIEIRNERTPLDAKLVQGTTVSGKVVNAEQKPVANARVLTNWATAVTAEDGSFTLRGLAPPLERIEASAGDAFGEATPGKEPTTIVITPRPTISGAVRGTDKRPVAGVPLMANGSTPMRPDGTMPSPARMRWAVTDERGNYRLEHLNADATYMIGPYLESELPLQPLTGVAAGAKNADLVATSGDAYTGIVLDENRKPVTGAVVQLLSELRPLVYGGVHRSTPTVRTGRDGRFSIPSNRTMVYGDRRMRLQASHRNYAIAASDDPSKEKPATLILPQGIEVKGEVVDRSGAPVAGAGVVVLQRASKNLPMALDSSLSSGALTPFVETDAEGKFTLRLNATTHDVGAWKQGSGGTQSSGVEVIAGMPPLRLVLEPNVAIRGRVVRGTEAVKEGSVMATGPNNSHASAQVEEDGTFALESLTAAQYRLEYMDNNGPVGETIAKAPADDVVITLAPASNVHGKVVDSETRATLRRYSVRLNGEQFRIATVNDEDTFTLEVPEGSAELVVVAGGYQKTTHRVNVAAGESVEVTIPVTRGRIINGIVRGEDGAPVGGASVRANKDDVTRTTPDGVFTMTVAPAPVQFDVRATGYLGKKVDLDSGITPARIDVTLARGRSIRGRVLTTADVPMPHTRVIAYVNDSTQEAETDAEGAFTMSGLEGGNVRFLAMIPRQRSEPVVVDLSKTSEVVIRVGPTGSTGTVVGIVKGFADGGWSMGSVQSGPAHTFIDRNGKYRLENVRAGEAQVVAMLTGIDDSMRTTAPVRVTVLEGGEVEANLEVGGGVSVQGLVTEDGVPLSGRHVGFNAGTRASTARTNAAGEYVVHGLEQGTTYFVTVGVPREGSPYVTQHTVTGNDRFDIRIEHARIEGRIIEASGRAIAGAWIAVVDDNAFNTPETRSDEGGAFALSVTRSNTLNVRISKDGFATVTRPVTGNAPMLITMTPSAGVRVRIVDARSGQPLSGWARAVDEQGQQVAQAREMNSDGTLTVPVGPGSVRISAGAMNYASQSAMTAVPRDGELRFALTPGGRLIVTCELATGDGFRLVAADGSARIGFAPARERVTTFNNIAPDSYTLQVVDAQRRVKASQPVTITEGVTTNVTMSAR